MKHTDLLTTSKLASEATSRTSKPIWPWTIRRAVDRGDVTHVVRVGSLRLFAWSDIDKIIKQLRATGYLDATAVA